MSEQQRETAFLRQLIAYDDTAERHKLEEGITQAQRDERCVRRAVWLMVLLAALAAVGLGYAAVLLGDYPHNMSRFVTHFLVKGSCVLGLASLISLLGFVGVGAVYRKNLGQRREECRRLAATLLESRLGRPGTVPLPGIVKEPEIINRTNPEGLEEHQPSCATPEECVVAT